MTMRTPWGPADDVTRDPVTGIAWVTTASHGGFYVPRELVAAIPANWRAYARIWSGSEQWYEEDCAWPAVCLTFPDYCRRTCRGTEAEHAEHVARARETAAHWLPDIEGPTPEGTA